MDNEGFSNYSDLREITCAAIFAEAASIIFPFSSTATPVLFAKASKTDCACATSASVVENSSLTAEICDG